MCVESLTLSITPDCDALKKLAGISPDFYVGAVGDLTGVTYDADGFITAFAFDTSKVLIKIKGKQKKNSYAEPIQDEGEGNIAIFQQTFTPKVYYSTQEQINAIEDIVGLDRAFAVFQGRDGKFKVVGITKEAHSFADWGAKVTGGDDVSGIALNDETVQTLIFTGDMPNKAMYFGEGSTAADNIATLDGYLTNP